MLFGLYHLVSIVSKARNLMFSVVVKEREHGSLVYVSGGEIDHGFRVRSGMNLNLFFPVYWFCDLGQASSPSESQFPVYKMRTLIFTLQDVENFKTNRAIHVNHLPPVGT